MEAWVCIIYLFSRAVSLDFQNEDAVVKAMKVSTINTINPIAVCFNQNDGTVLFFNKGKQVNGL